MIHTTSVTELRDRLAETIDKLNDDNAVMVVRHSRPAAYLLSPELYESMLARIERLEAHYYRGTGPGEEKSSSSRMEF